MEGEAEMQVDDAQKDKEIIKGVRKEQENREERGNC